MSASGLRNGDRRLVLALLAAAIAVIALASILAPTHTEDDPVPTTYNTHAAGAKAAYLLLGQLGYQTGRSEQRAATALQGADAQRTTYILAGPSTPREDATKEDYAAIESFLRRGGRVIATGFDGAYFLPGGRAGAATQVLEGLCYTTPEGLAPMARVGSIPTVAHARWAGVDPATRVDQYCGNDAVVVHQRVGKGEAIWWSSAEPLSNRGIRQDANFQLLLTAVGAANGPEGRRIFFDEFYHGAQAVPVDYLHGLPLTSLALQASVVLLLLILSFSRRSGPLREPVRVNRSSPLEFANSMGALYERANATTAATESARRRLLRFLEEQCGLSKEAARGSASQVAAAVHARFDGPTEGLERALQRAEDARYARTRPRDALRIIEALTLERDRLNRRMHTTEEPTSR